MTTKIFNVDDGGAHWWIAADDHSDALNQWVQHMIDVHGYMDADHVISEFEEPEVMLIQPAAAAGIKIRSDDKEDSCPECGGRGKVPHYDRLLEVFQEDQKLPEKKRAKNGILACSEW